MDSDRIKEIQKTTAYPDSVSVKQALLQVWNECEQKSLISKLKEDKELRRAYHDNIAMSFKDSYFLYMKKNNKKMINKETLHIIANNAAENFLNLLCSE